MLVLVSMMAVLQTVPTAEQGAELNALVRSTKACVSAAAVRLEPSGEAAPVIADAARTSCDSERAALEAHVRSMASTPEGGETMARRVMATLDAEIRSSVVLSVTETRSERRAH